MKVDPKRNIDELYDSLPEEERVTAAILREVVKEVLPHAREKISWGAPFYHGKRVICFVWPASIHWGRLKSGVALGFPRADLLDHDDFLGGYEKGNFGRVVYHNPEEIDVERVKGLLEQAKIVDERK